MSSRRISVDDVVVVVNEVWYDSVMNSTSSTTCIAPNGWMLDLMTGDGYVPVGTTDTQQDFWFLSFWPGVDGWVAAYAVDGDVPDSLGTDTRGPFPTLAAAAAATA